LTPGYFPGISAFLHEKSSYPFEEVALVPFAMCLTYRFR